MAECRARWAEPGLVRKINDGIEQNRKGNAAIQVINTSGQPLAGAAISAEQTTHAFLFGANLFVLGQSKTPDQNAKYEQAFARLFNFASLPFYWGDLEPEKGALRFGEDAPFIWRRPPPDVLLNWCEANGIVPKGHPLLWHAINPGWMPNEPDALRVAYAKRFQEIAARYAARIPIWDIVNESLVCPKSYPLYSDERAYVPWAFNEVEKYFKASNVTMINEVMPISHAPLVNNRYFRQVDTLLKAGTGIRGIGFQFHFFSRKDFVGGLVADLNMAPENLLAVYDGFAALGLPLFITEITIPAEGPDGPALQAEFTANLYRLWFSVRGMAGVTWWNLADNTAYGSENTALAGLVDENMVPKPAYDALDRLINTEWKTRFHGTADSEGRCAFRGFAGDYTITIDSGDGKIRQFEMPIAAGADNSRKFTCAP